MTNPMMNNPLGMLMQSAMRGGNPLQMIQQMASTNPRAAQAFNTVRGKSPAQLQETARAMARERGTTPEAIRQQLISQFGIR